MVFSSLSAAWVLLILIRSRLSSVRPQNPDKAYYCIFSRKSPLTYCSSFCTFPIPHIFALTFSHVFCLSWCPTAYPICPILCSGSALPAGHGQRLPEGRTGVAAHTPLNTQLPVASGGHTPNHEQMHTLKHKGTPKQGYTCNKTFSYIKNIKVVQLHMTTFTWHNSWLTNKAHCRCNLAVRSFCK